MACVSAFSGLGSLGPVAVMMAGSAPLLVSVDLCVCVCVGGAKKSHGCWRLARV
jgi:hypothetical protein